MTLAADPVGFVGVGNMGGAMALRVLDQGGAVVAYDVSASARERLAAAGATIVNSPAAVAERCAAVSLVVNYDDQVLSAVLAEDGVLAGATPATVVAIHSTIHLDTLEAVAARAAQQSVAVLDAAVTGGVDAAARGQLAVLLGGDARAVENIRPVLSHYASVVVRAGDLGAGMAAKLAVMVVSFGTLAAAYEGLLLAESAGVDVVELARVISHSEAQSGIHSFFLDARARLLHGDVESSLREIAGHESPKAQKDLHAALELAMRVGVELPVTRMAHDEMPDVWGLRDPASERGRS